MHARSPRTPRTAALAVGLGFLLALSACSSEESTAGADSGADAQVASKDDGAPPAEASKPSADAMPKAAVTAADDAKKRDEERRLNSKPDDRGGKQEPGRLDPAEYKAKVMELSERLNRGEIDRKQYEIERSAIEQAMRGQTAAPVVVDPAGAKLVFATKEHDFGTVWDTDDLTFEFAFENQGQKTLEITRVKPSCGCTTTSLSRTSFEPGEGEMIPMVWKPKGVGPQKKTITISHNNGPDQVLNISANVKPFVQVEPKLLRLGDLPQHEAHHAELKLTPADPNFEITNIKASNQYLTAVESGRDSDGNILLDVIIKEDAPWGNFNARLEVTGTGTTEPGTAPVEHTIMTQVIAKMYGDIRMEPEQIQLGVVSANGPFKGEALLYHVRGEPFEVTDLTMRFSRPEMTIRQEPTTHEGNAAIKIIIEGDTTGFTERYVRGTAFFKTNLGGQENQQLQIAGSVR